MDCEHVWNPGLDLGIELWSLSGFAEKPPGKWTIEFPVPLTSLTNMGFETSSGAGLKVKVCLQQLMRHCIWFGPR
jgi:hypothetical protein